MSEAPHPRPPVADPTADVACRASDGSERPMREVLAERAANARTQSKAAREEARRIRAGMIGALQACECAWPAIRSETETGHAAWCLAHRWISTGQVPDSNDAAERGEKARRG